MDWKLELDALIESTMTFAKDVKPRPISDLALVARTAEQALADKSRPIPRPASVTPMTRPTSERDDILRRVSNFRAHQEKWRGTASAITCKQEQKRWRSLILI
jgi:hypothetical protein